MANFIDPVSGDIFLSVHTPDGEARGWLKNPIGLATVMNVPAIYRVVEGDSVREATDKECEAIDATRFPQIKAAKREEIVSALSSDVLSAKAAEVAAAVDAFATKCKAALTAVDAAKSIGELDVIKTSVEVAK